MSFSFHPELFEHRGDAIEALADAGLDWLSDYSSVDVLHDLFGLEVCGLREEDEARVALDALRARFPGWRFGHVQLKDWGGRDTGWRAVLHRDPREERAGETEGVN